MNVKLEKLASRIGEGLQTVTPAQPTPLLNVFHRSVSVFNSSDLSFINGLITSGLRGTAFLNGEKLISNYSRLFSAIRHHLPLVINVEMGSHGSNDYSSFNFAHPINAIGDLNCFKFIAGSLPSSMPICSSSRTASLNYR